MLTFLTQTQRTTRRLCYSSFGYIGGSTAEEQSSTPHLYHHYTNRPNSDLLTQALAPSPQPHHHHGAQRNGRLLLSLSHLHPLPRTPWSPPQPWPRPILPFLPLPHRHAHPHNAPFPPRPRLPHSPTGPPIHPLRVAGLPQARRPRHDGRHRHVRRPRLLPAR
ncbi:hypothetical protein VTI74DRAFT_5025 [Chaetomium olivicolor]